MKTIIHKIRRQPEHIKRQILYISTVGFGIILVLLWIYSLGTNLSNVQAGSQLKQDLQPLTSLQQDNTPIPTTW